MTIGCKANEGMRSFGPSQLAGLALTDPEKQIALALGACSFSPGTWDKRFCHAMATKAAKEPEDDLSERQRDNLLRMAHKYRRQLSRGVHDTVRCVLAEAKV